MAYCSLEQTAPNGIRLLCLGCFSRAHEAQRRSDSWRQGGKGGEVDLERATLMASCDIVMGACAGLFSSQMIHSIVHDCRGYVLHQSPSPSLRLLQLC